MSNFVMIDLETFGATPGCSIATIGACVATGDGYILSTFYTVVSRQSCREYGLFEEQSTLDWWASQPNEARDALSHSTASNISLPEALQALNNFIRHSAPNAEVYGNGSDFDNAILSAAARAAHIELAWPFFRNRCYRTIKSRMPWIGIVREGTHHNALDDAINQARHLGRLQTAMRLNAGTVADASRFIGWMADHYRRRCTRRFLGIPLERPSRVAALEYAAACFDSAVDLNLPFGHPDADWSLAGARDLIDDDMSYGEG